MYTMKRYPASVARERMADVLDEVERNGAALIERAGVQYVIRKKGRPARAKPPRGGIEIIDPAVAAGEWRWDYAPGGVRFKGAPRRRR
jgi:hypothetical protein